MNETANATSIPSQSDVMSAWKTLKCSVDLGCQYQKKFPVPPDLVPPKVCPPLQPPPPGRRRKRQAPPGGPGGPGGDAPPPVNPDFNTSTIFLKKYMELDEQDRFAIGHRFNIICYFFPFVFSRLFTKHFNC
jgi:hypothetical protein